MNSFSVCLFSENFSDKYSIIKGDGKFMVYFDNLSASKMASYEQCPFKFAKKYIDKLPGIFNPNSSESAMQFGSYIHRIFERGIETLTEEALKSIAAEERANYKFEGYSPATVLKCITNFIEFNKRIEGETIGVEFEWEAEFTDGLKTVGIIDRVVRAPNGNILLIDYKTSKRPKTSSDLNKDFQAQLYVMVASKLWNKPYNNIMFIHYYPVQDKIVPIKFFDYSIQNFKSKTIKKVWEIRKAKKEDLKPRINDWCGSCEYKGICPLWASAEEIQRSMLEKEQLIQEHKEKLKNRRKG
jgi:putative RecB family exonuclease